MSIQTTSQHKTRSELLAGNKGKYALIFNDRIIDIYESHTDALKAGHQKFGWRPFSVKRISLQNPKLG